MKTSHTIALSFLGMVAIIASFGLILSVNSYTGMFGRGGQWEEDAASFGNELTGEQVRYGGARTSTPYQVLYGRGGSSYVYTPPTPKTSQVTVPSYGRASSLTKSKMNQINDLYAAKRAQTPQRIASVEEGACCSVRPRNCIMTTRSKCNWFYFYPGRTCWNRSPC